MAVETEIDSLVLDISVKDNEGKESSAKKISTLDRVLNRFQKTVLNLDTKSFKSKFASMTTALKPFVNELNSAKSSILALSKVMSKLGSNGKLPSADNNIGTQDTNVSNGAEGNLPGAQSGNAQQLDNGNPKSQIQTLDDLIDKYGEVSKHIVDANGKSTYFFQKIDGNTKTTTKWAGNFDKNGKIIEKDSKLLGQTFNKAQTPMEEFLSSMKRIAMYRAIRTVLKSIIDIGKSGVENLAKFDSQTNATLGKLSSSLVVIQNSLGAIIMPILQIAQPIISGIAKAIGTLSNAISYLTAKLKGESKWIKVNTDYLKEYREQAKLLSFDEFSSLSADETTGMFTEEEMSGSSISSILDDCNVLSGILAGIATTLAIIGVAKIITMITDGSLVKLLGKVIAKISALSASTLAFMGTISGLAVGIGVLVAGIVTFVTSLNDMSNTAKWLIPTIAVLAATLTGLAVAHAAAKAGLAAPAMAGFTAAAIAAGIALAAGTAIAVSQHANGGMFEGTGTIYHQAGEAGAEIVAQGSRGTGVTNISQFKQAMVEALSEYNAARNTDDVGTLVVQLDGKEIARSQVQNNASALMKNYNIVLKPR